MVEAEKFLLQAKSSNKYLPEHYTNLALLQMENGRFREAILNLDSAIALDKTDGELYINRGLAKEKVKDWKGAAKDFERALQIDAEWPKAWFVQGNHFMKLKKWNEAFENYSVAIAFNENYGAAYYNRAIVQYELGRKKNACQDLLTAQTKGMKIELKMKSRFCD